MFEVNVTAQDGWTILMPVGDLDMASTPELRSHLNRAVSATGGRVIVDKGNGPLMANDVIAYIRALKTVNIHTDGRILKLGD